MPLKTKNHHTKKYPHHYNKVYWPYLPLIVLVLTGLWLGHPLVNRAQRGVLAYSTDVTDNSLLIDSNQARKDNAKPVLVENSQLDQAANAKAQDMMTRDYWSHMTPDGKTPWTFVSAAGYHYQKAGENLAYGFGSSSEVIKGWLNSPAHKENLLDSNYRDVGFGIANSPNYQGNGPETIVVAIYGQPGNMLASTGSVVHGNQAFNSDNPLAREANLTITKAQAITGGRAPWITLAVGIAGGIGIAFILGKNSVLIHRKLRKGEKFMLKHPVTDITVVVFVALCALLTQSVGLIR
jgi:hypothetical protein